VTVTLTTGDASPDPGTRDPSPWLDAVDRYRDVAKWLIAAFGAIGAVIAGTAPLSGIGNLKANRVDYVVAGGMIALSGVAVVLAATVTILAPQTVYRHQLRAARQGPLRRRFTGLGRFENLLATHPADLLPTGINTVDQLDEAITNLVTAGTAMAARAALPADGGEQAARKRAALAINAERRRHENARRQLLDVARFEQAHTRFNRAVLAVLVGGVAAATGLALTLYGIANQPQQPSLPKPTLSDPSPITVTLTPTGTQTLQRRLGLACDTSRLSALLLGGDRISGPWDVVVLPQPGCTPIRVVLGVGLAAVG
jgi:hypothetical protein